MIRRYFPLIAISALCSYAGHCTGYISTTGRIEFAKKARFIVEDPMMGSVQLQNEGGSDLKVECFDPHGKVVQHHDIPAGGSLNIRLAGMHEVVVLNSSEKKAPLSYRAHIEGATNRLRIRRE